MTLSVTVGQFLILSSVATSNNNTWLPQKSTGLPQFQIVNSTFVLDFIRQIQMKYNFNTFIFYITTELQESTFQEFFQHFWIEFSLITTIIIRDSNKKNRYPMDGYLTASTISIVFTTGVDDHVMDLSAASLRGVRFLKTIFILYPKLEHYYYIYDFNDYTKFTTYVRSIFEYIWKRQFLSVVLISICNTVNTLDPYPTFRIVDNTFEWKVDDLFKRLDWPANWRGFVVDSPIQYDLPLVFPLTRQHAVGDKRNNWLSGTSALLFQAFIESINATIMDSSTYILDPFAFKFEYIFQRIIDGSIEISLHSHTFIAGSPITASYPIGINDFCIMLPKQNQYPEHLYLPRAFSLYTWILIIFGCFYISVSVWICTPSSSRDYGASFLQAICSMLCIMPTFLLRSKNFRTRYLFVLLFLLGFITSQIYVCRMASLLTSSPTEPQIDTIDGIIAAKLQIMVLSMEYKTLKQLPNFTKTFLKNLKIVDKQTMNSHRDNLNTSFGYSVTTDRWRFLDKQQSFLRKPIFYLTKICTGPFYHGYPMQRDSHFHIVLHFFIMLVYQSGLTEIWEERSFADALRLKYITMMRVNEEPIPLSVEFFLGIWCVCGSGLILAFVIFIFEIKCGILRRITYELIKLWRRLLAKV